MGVHQEGRGRSTSRRGGRTGFCKSQEERSRREGRAESEGSGCDEGPSGCNSQGRSWVQVRQDQELGPPAAKWLLAKCHQSSSIGEAISICRGKCNGCPAFFYQKHRNGHQICGFYKTIISGTRQWHGHAEGALCEIKPYAGFKRYNPKFVYPKFKNNPDNYLNYCVAYTSPGGACKMQFCMGGGSKACRSQCSA